MRNYYHGTDAEAARAILEQGFTLEHRTWGRGWGNGVYLAGTPDFASTWGDVVVLCRLERGTRVLWHQRPEPAVLDHIRREFGKDVLEPTFWKAVPENKSLTRKEAVNLWHHLIDRSYSNPRRFKRRSFQRLADQYPRLYGELRRHGYHAVAFRPDTDWPEVLVFNPGRVHARSAHFVSNAPGTVGPAIAERELIRLARGVRRRNQQSRPSD